MTENRSCQARFPSLAFLSQRQHRSRISNTRILANRSVHSRAAHDRPVRRVGGSQCERKAPQTHSVCTFNASLLGKNERQFGSDSCRCYSYNSTFANVFSFPGIAGALVSTYVDVNPRLLRWAIDRSGLPVGDYPPPVAGWLSGAKKPTHGQLEAFARRAMVPFGYLFLEHPPDEALPAPDYRTRSDQGVRRPTPNLIETIFEMQRRQDWMRERLVEEGQEELPFVGSARIGDEVAPLAARIRRTLGLDGDWAAHQGNWEDALRSLRDRIEDSGILIFVNGIVGNNTRRKLDPEEFQGFVLVDRVVPLIFVNGADYKVAQMFTIAHELAHVWVGESALFDLTATNPADFAVERYCNLVAAEILVPADMLREAWSIAPKGDAIYALLAKRFKVSPVVVARRAKDQGLITSEEFFSFYHSYMQRERTLQQERRSGGNFWLTQDVRLGRRFGAAVIAAAEESRLSYTDAYDLTRLYGATFDKYAQLLRQKGRE